MGLAFGAFAVDVGAGFGVAASPGHGDAVDGGVELAVAAAVEAVAVGLAGTDRDWGEAAGAVLGGSRCMGASVERSERCAASTRAVDLRDTVRRDLGDYMLATGIRDFSVPSAKKAARVPASHRTRGSCAFPAPRSSARNAVIRAIPADRQSRCELDSVDVVRTPGLLHVVRVSGSNSRKSPANSDDSSETSNVVPVESGLNPDRRRRSSRLLTRKGPHLRAFRRSG